MKYFDDSRMKLIIPKVAISKRGNNIPWSSFDSNQPVKENPKVTNTPTEVPVRKFKTNKYLGFFDFSANTQGTTHILQTPPNKEA